MTKAFGTLGGRDDVWLARDLPDLGRWRPVGVAYMEADEVSPAGEFPQHGHFLEAETVEDGEEVYVQVTEQLEAMMVEVMEGQGVGLDRLSVDVDAVNQEEGADETAPLRYVADIAPLGPP